MDEAATICARLAPIAAAVAWQTRVFVLGCRVEQVNQQRPPFAQMRGGTPDTPGILCCLSANSCTGALRFPGAVLLGWRSC
jgi:hypothetical protein